MFHGVSIKTTRISQGKKSIEGEIIAIWFNVEYVLYFDFLIKLNSVCRFVDEHQIKKRLKKSTIGDRKFGKTAVLSYGVT